MLSQLEGVVGTKNNDHLVGDSPGDATAAVSNGANWLIGGSGSDLIEGRGGNDVIIGGSIRLDTLIGSYAGGYYNDTVTTIDGASHRAIGALSGGLLDAASTGGVTFEKHFTELLKSAAYKDYVLGDGGPDGTQDMAVFTGAAGTTASRSFPTTRRHPTASSRPTRSPTRAASTRMERRVRRPMERTC